MDDESGESMELMEEVPFIRLGEPELWLTERSRKLIARNVVLVVPGQLAG